MEKLSHQILKLFPQLLKKIILLSLVLFSSCKTSETTVYKNWVVNSGNFSGISYINYKKVSTGAINYEYQIEVTKSEFYERCFIQKFIHNGDYIYKWLGINDTTNVKYLYNKNYKFVIYNSDDKAFIKKVLSEKGLPNLRKKQIFFDSINYFVFIDSIYYKK